MNMALHIRVQIEKRSSGFCLIGRIRNMYVLMLLHPCMDRLETRVHTILLFWK